MMFSCPKVPIIPSCFKLPIVIFLSNIHHFAYLKDDNKSSYGGKKRERRGEKRERIERKERKKERKKRKKDRKRKEDKGNDKRDLVQEKIQINMNFSTII